MKKITDYIFYDSWQLRELNIKPNDEFTIVNDLCDLKKDERVKFVGFDDVDNHYGIFVFINTAGEVQEVPGDFSSPGGSSLKNLRAALSD